MGSACALEKVSAVVVAMVTCVVVVTDSCVAVLMHDVVVMTMYHDLDHAWLLARHVLVEISTLTCCDVVVTSGPCLEKVIVHHEL